MTLERTWLPIWRQGLGHTLPCKTISVPSRFQAKIGALLVNPVFVSQYADRGALHVLLLLPVYQALDSSSAGAADMSQSDHRRQWFLWKRTRKSSRAQSPSNLSLAAALPEEELTLGVCKAKLLGQKESAVLEWIILLYAPAGSWERVNIFKRKSLVRKMITIFFSLKFSTL